MAGTRTRLVVGVMLGGLVGGMTLTGALRSLHAGPGDPPVIVLPSARTAQPPVMVQAIPPSANVPKLELLPPPAELASPAKSPQPVAPPLLAPAENTLRTPPFVPTLTPKEVAPLPRQVVAAQPSQGPTPSALAPPGDSTMPMRTTAAALTAIVGTAPVNAAEIAKPAPVIEKITDYARSNDVKSLREEIEALRKQVAALSGHVAELPKTVPVNDNAKADDVKSLKEEIDGLRKQITALSVADTPKAADVKALKEEIELLKKEIAGKSADQPKAADWKALKEEIAQLKKDIAALATKPVDNTAMKEEVDALRKDVQTLNAFLRESLQGKVDDKGFTHDGLIKRLEKLDGSIDTLSKKVAAIDNTRTAGSSPVKGPEAPAQHGVVRIVNDYPIEISIVVNGVAHRIDPSTKKDVIVPTGSFKYQLLTSGGAETERSIKDNETVTLTIR